jgi:hypothetical protein
MVNIYGDKPKEEEKITPFKASHPAFDPPESIKSRREETLKVFAAKFGMTPRAIDTIRIMTETFFKAGMDRTAELEKKIKNGEMTREDFDDIIKALAND